MPKYKAMIFQRIATSMRKVFIIMDACHVKSLPPNVPSTSTIGLDIIIILKVKKRMHLLFTFPLWHRRVECNLILTHLE